MSAVKTVTNCCAGRGVHSACWSTDVDDRDAELFFFGESDVEF